MNRNWYLPVFFLYLRFCTPISASPHGTFDTRNTTSAAHPTVTPPPLHNLDQDSAGVRKRQDDDGGETCGFHDGDPDRPRTAEDGFDCRIDTEQGLWGFCPTTVNAASDCGLAGNCVDRHDCSRGCGIRGTSGITTFTCDRDQFCSTVILALNDDAGFSYIACGATALTHTLLPTPTESSETRTTDSDSSSAESSNPTDAAGSPTPTPSSEPEAASDKGDSGGPPNNTGAIIGGVIGGIALLCISVVATVYLLRRNRNQRAAEENPHLYGAPISAYYPHDTSNPTLEEPQVVSELDGQRNSKPSELPG